MVVEPLPPLDFDKGAVIRRQIADLHCADDPDFASFRIAVRNPETGHALEDIVDLVLPSQPAVIALVRDVAAALRDSYSAEDRLQR